MENGHDTNLAEKMSGLGLRDNHSSSSNNDSLFQVMKAVEAAEATIKQQKLDESLAQRSHFADPWDERAHRPDPSVIDQEDKLKDIDFSARVEPSSMLVLHQDLKPQSEGPIMQSHAETHSDKINGTVKPLHAGMDNPGVSHFSSPSAASFPPSRYQAEGEHEPRHNLSGHGLMQMAEVNQNGLWKQDYFLKAREHEEEIMQLRKHLANYSVKEAQIRNEKYVLEKRIAYMRLAFDQQQQDLVDAASKALSYRQDIIEENIRLTYELQASFISAAQQERSTFVSSLLPLLAEYSLQPPVPDAQSIVSNVKVLFRHLQEKLIHTESKLKESQYQLSPWHSDVAPPNFAPQSPSHSMGSALTMNKNGLELVPQPYSHGKIPITSDTHTVTDWDVTSHQQSVLSGTNARNLESDDVGRYSPLASRSTLTHDTPTQITVSRDDAQPIRYGEETSSKQVIFRDPVSNSEMDEPEAEGNQTEREPSAHWGTGNSPYSTSLDEPSSSYSPYLPPVLEEPSSSFSEAADDDPLPAIEGLQISGEAFPGRELQACGYSINGTTSCNFEWVRHLEDGSVNYIEGAKQPNYLVTADDVDTYLAIEVQPLDDRKRKGELVKVFANEHRKIRCDPEMHDHIQSTLYGGQASFRVSLSVIIPYGHATEFVIVDSSGRQHLLRADSSSTDIRCSRDTIVLTLRLFIKQVYLVAVCIVSSLRLDSKLIIALQFP
ncbi:hypothetical protein Tsubulata_035704 [Turnera subulata]|uniref:Uncharacterized protein n=1 Tax=Turnera subulata TaxID=218843 RepID=A0A9Q0FDT0_9ROSI|nr:hypothetical protein Tsubulata_035704 [Turnera subulata]